jgi:hypothetical protein
MKRTQRTRSTSSLFVYFVQAAGPGGPIKIGSATDLYKRVSAIQTGNHEEVKLIALIRADDARVVEWDWQVRFRHLRIRFEWFSPGADLLSAIAAEALTPEEWRMGCRVADKLARAA